MITAPAGRKIKRLTKISFEEFKKLKGSDDITKCVKSYEDACEALNISALSIRNFWFLPQGEEVNAFGYHKLCIIAQALNEGWKPNWGNDSEYKYYPWFTFSGSAFRFSYTRSDYTSATIGARLCFKTEQLAEYAGKTFLAEYNEYMIVVGK